jgi:tRNA(fMet)-specific endonuclease VapC
MTFLMSTQACYRSTMAGSDMADFTYLLDTNILSHLIRNPRGRVAQHIAHVGEKTVCTSIVVACELRFGSEKSGSAPLRARVEQLLRVLEVVTMDVGTDVHYAEIRAGLERSGEPIGPNDLLIAAHARSNNMTLVSANIREFSRVPGLSVENWLS